MLDASDLPPIEANNCGVSGAYKFFYIYLLFSILHFKLVSVLIFLYILEITFLGMSLIQLFIIIPMIIDLVLLALYCVNSKINWELKSVVFDMDQSLKKLIGLK